MVIYEKAKPLTSIDLNYEVVGGKTPPTTFKKENTLWVDTDMEIGEHEFSYVEPTTRADGSDLQNGDVWIQTDIDKAPAGFNAIKKNELMIYPIKLNQWTGSKWKSVAGTLYQGGTATLVYTAGYSLIDNFSSYTVTAWDLTTVLGRPSDTFGLAKSGNNLIYTCGAGKQNVNLIPTFDLSKYSALVITVSAQTLNTSKGVRIGFVTWENRGADLFSAAAEIFKPGTYRVDLSKLTSSLYFSIRPINDTGYTGTLTISELTLEE